MLSLELGFAIIPGLIPSPCGIERFSREIQGMAGEQSRSMLGNPMAS